MIRFTEDKAPTSAFTLRRRALDLSVEQLANLAGITVDALSQCEATPRESRAYNAAIAKRVERALLAAEKRKADIGSSIAGDGSKRAL